MTLSRNSARNLMDMKRAFLVGVLLSFLSCAHVVDQTQFMTVRFQRAEAACKAMPQGKLGTKQENDRITLCTKAETCANASGDALKALKDSQEAIASGAVNIAYEVKAAVTGGLANLACGGW